MSKKELLPQPQKKQKELLKDFLMLEDSFLRPRCKQEAEEKVL
jgi:hypothetical protein